MQATSDPLAAPGLSRKVRSGATIAVAFLLAACAAPSELVFAPEAAGPPTETVLVASIRAPEAGPAVYANRPGRELTFARFEITVPPAYRPGGAAVVPRRPGDPSRHFLVASAYRIPDEQSFVAALNRRLQVDPGPDCAGGVFVHGYRNSFADSLLYHARLQADYDQHGAIIHFEWPATPRRLAYLRDLDRALAARDALARTLDILAESQVRQIGVLGNSLGAFLVMDTLRTMVLSSRHEPVFAKLDTVVLTAADIDLDVFAAQVAPVVPRGARIVVVTSQRDRALHVAAMLRGAQPRIGALRPEAFAGLPVTVLDATDLPVGDSSRHQLLVRCPDLTALAREIHAAGDAAILPEGRLRPTSR
jgi:esterase/lipase superfamily enzyme